jgi:hypothetical protein
LLTAHSPDPACHAPRTKQDDERDAGGDGLVESEEDGGDDDMEEADGQIDDGARAVAFDGSESPCLCSRRLWFAARRRDA